LVEICWRVKSNNGHVITCAISSDSEPGIMVSAGYASDHVVWSQRTFHVEKGRTIAAAWLGEALRTGFEQIPIE
jgi:hypothetical protein